MQKGRKFAVNNLAAFGGYFKCNDLHNFLQSDISVAKFLNYGINWSIMKNYTNKVVFYVQ